MLGERVVSPPPLELVVGERRERGTPISTPARSSQPTLPRCIRRRRSGRFADTDPFPSPLSERDGLVAQVQEDRQAGRLSETAPDWQVILTLAGDLSIANTKKHLHKATRRISLTLGSLPSSYDFGTINLTTGDTDPVGTKPATVQVHTFTVKPGETIDWHYHRALAYVVIEHGTLSEQHLNGNGTCLAWVAFGRDPPSWKSPVRCTRVPDVVKTYSVGPSRLTGLASEAL